MPAVKLTINNKATTIVQDYAYTHALKDEMLYKGTVVVKSQQFHMVTISCGFQSKTRVSKLFGRSDILDCLLKIREGRGRYLFNFTE